MSVSYGEMIRSTWFRLWSRPAGRVIVAGLAVLAVIYLFEIGGEVFRAELTSNLDRVMLPLMVVLLAACTRRVARTEERRFWRFMILALSAWLLGSFLYLIEIAAGLPRWVDLAVDVFYITLYLGMFLASDQQPQLHSGWSKRDPVYPFGMVAASIFIAIMFGYFVVVPWAIQPSETSPYFSSFNLYVTLDLLLTLRFVLLHMASTDPRWKRCFALLAVATTALAVGDLLEGLYFAEIFVVVIGARLDVIWLIPYFCLTAVALTCTPEPGDESESEGGRQVGSLVAVYAFALPLIHLGLYLLGYLDPGARSAREAIVFGGLVFFAGLIVVQQTSLERAVVSLRSNLSVRALDDKLRQSQRLESIGRLAGGIAHDFNNLLMVIKSYSELASHSLGERSPAVRAKLDEIDRAADRAADLIRQLLAFGRRQVVRPELVRLDEMVLSLEGMLSRIIGDDLRLTVSVGSGRGCARVDPALLEQVIVNLVVNARDAMPRGGDVTIETRIVKTDAHDGATGSRDGWVELAVTDTGTGISPEVQHRIFEPYFTTKEMGKGTGLGLATVYGIVEQSGGTIDVESVVGQGTSFKVRFPRVDEEPTARADSQPVADRPLAGRTVLITEDEANIREALAEYLESLGLEVLAAEDGVHALEVAEAHDGVIDVLVSDLVMPRMSGPDLADRLLELRHGVKVIYVSGYTPEAMREYGVNDADAVFLQKPFLLGELSEKVRQVLED